MFRGEMYNFSESERVQFTAPANNLSVANRALGMIERAMDHETERRPA